MAVAGVCLGSRIGPAIASGRSRLRPPFRRPKGVRLRPAIHARLARKHSAAALPVVVPLAGAPFADRLPDAGDKLNKTAPRRRKEQ